jgi:hypothetical protein
MPSPEIGIPAGASLLGGYLASSGAKEAAGTQAGAADRAAALQERIYNSMAERNLPAESLGNLARNRYGELVGLGPNTNAMGYGSAVRPFSQEDLDRDVIYGNALRYGDKALRQARASQGRLMSGGTALESFRLAGGPIAEAARTRYRENISDQLNPLTYAMTGGTNATNATNTALGNYGTNATNALVGGANARASGYVGGANALSSALSTGLNYANNNAMLNAYNNRTLNPYSVPTANTNPAQI